MSIAKKKIEDQPSILVVDDEKETLKQIVEILSDLKAEIRPTQKASLALQAIHYKLPDLILLDIQMPEINGFELCKQIKVHPETKSIPVMFISGLGNEQHIVKGFKSGAVDYITKPFRDQELLARVSTHLEMFQLKRKLEQLVKQRTFQLTEKTRLLEAEVRNQKDLQNRLRESDSNNRKVVDSLQECIAVLNPDGHVLFANQEFKQSFDLARIAEDVEPHLSDLFSENQSEELVKRLRQTLIAKSNNSSQIRLDSKAEERWFDCDMLPIRFGRKNQQAVLLILLDKTVQKEIERSLEQKREELQQLSVQLIKTQEEERRTVSQELHDEVGQALTAMQINLEFIEQQLGPECLRRVNERLTESIDLNDQILSQIREISLDLRPSMLDDLGLVPTLNWYVNRFAKRTKLSVVFNTDGIEGRLSPEIETTFYRAVQEALTNITKHAKADRVIIDFVKREQQILLIIQDDGVGFKINQLNELPRPGRGIGLIGMRERVTNLDGEFQIESIANKGTRISMSLPCR